MKFDTLVKKIERFGNLFSIKYIYEDEVIEVRYNRMLIAVISNRRCGCLRTFINARVVGLSQEELHRFLLILCDFAATPIKER